MGVKVVFFGRRCVEMRDVEVVVLRGKRLAFPVFTEYSYAEETHKMHHHARSVLFINSGRVECNE